MFNKKILSLVALLVMALVLSACGGQASEPDAVEVQITLTEYGVESSVSVFEVGVPYHFTVVNEGEEEHEIMLMPQMTTEDMLALMNGDDHDDDEAHEEGDSHDDDDMMAEDDHDDDDMMSEDNHEGDEDSHNDGEDDHSHDMLMEEGIVFAAVDAHDLQPGDTASFEYTFTEVTGFGEIEFACHLEGHYEEGMFLPIFIQ